MSGVQPLKREGGPIIDRTNSATPQVFGRAADDTLGSSHPNANFSYSGEITEIPLRPGGGGNA